MELRGLLNDRKKILPYTRRVGICESRTCSCRKAGVDCIEALEKRCAEKNEENARLEMEKTVFYGPRRYSLPMYLQYELTRFRLDFVQPTENIRKSGISPEITENQKKAFYERNKDLFGRYFGDLFSYEEVEQIIEKRLREEVYDRLVQEILCRFDKRK